MTDKKPRKGVREIPETHELRGHRLKLYPYREQIEMLERMQEEMRRAWNLLVGWRIAHLDAAVARAERDGVVGREPDKPEKRLNEDDSGENRERWRVYLDACRERRRRGIAHSIETVAGYGFMRLGVNAWDYGPLRDFVVQGEESVCSAHQYQALIKNFMKAKRPRPRKKNEPGPLQVTSGVCYVRSPPKDAVNERSRRIADATIVFGGMRIRAREPYRLDRAKNHPDKGPRHAGAPAIEGVALRKETDGWYAAVRLIVPKRTVKPWSVDAVVGVAVGLDTLCATSSGRVFPNLRRAETTRRVAELQQREARDTSDEEEEEHWSEWKWSDGTRTRISTQSARLQTRQRRAVRQYIEREILPYLARYRFIIIAPESDDDLKPMAQGRQTRLTVKGRGGYVSAMGLLLSKIRGLGEARVREVEWMDRARTCSRCGLLDVNSWRWRETPYGSCVGCGYTEHRKINTARNTRRKGLELLESEGVSFNGGTTPENS